MDNFSSQTISEKIEENLNSNNSETPKAKFKLVCLDKGKFKNSLPDSSGYSRREKYIARLKIKEFDGKRVRAPPSSPKSASLTEKMRGISFCDKKEFLLQVKGIITLKHVRLLKI